jgi:hypothetical protein
MLKVPFPTSGMTEEVVGRQEEMWMCRNTRQTGITGVWPEEWLIVMN